MSGLDFTRSEPRGPAQRTMSDYDRGGFSDPLRVAHAPGFEQARRELAGAIRSGPDDPDDPVERAKLLLERLDELRQLFVADGSAEALQFEAELRADRPPPGKPAASEAERFAAAKAALGDT